MKKFLSKIMVFLILLTIIYIITAQTFRYLDLQVKGESFMWADRAESHILQHTKEVFPGLFVAGMAANAVGGESRMGAVFGGMLLSGEQAANLVLKSLKK